MLSQSRLSGFLRGTGVLEEFEGFAIDLIFGRKRPGAELLPVDGLGHRFIAQDRDVIERVTAFVEG